jgi:4-hydroxyphenylpyruvate dioxygenase
LLDSQLDVDSDEEADIDNKKNNYLLQVFTQPIFDKNTLFFELIQRVGNAKGFGAGNIKALWDAVQLHLNKKQN